MGQVESGGCRLSGQLRGGQVESGGRLSGQLRGGQVEWGQVFKWGGGDLVSSLGWLSGQLIGHDIAELGVPFRISMDIDNDILRTSGF